MQLVFRSFLLCTLLLARSTGVARASMDCKGSKIAHTITVDQCCSNYRTVQSAIDSIAGENNQWVKIHIKPGTYKEKVQIPIDKPCIFLEGEGSSVTIITYDDHQRTDLSATFTSFPDNVVAKGITFENSYNIAAEIIPEELDRRNKDSGNKVLPAVAARIYGDKSAFYECSFLGVQDTLWDAQGRHFFETCYIEGAVDFIFGYGQSVYENCIINSTAGLIFGTTYQGYITAQGRFSANDPSGFVIRGGSVSGSGQVYLGRAYGPYSRVIFTETWLSPVVTPPGWDAWNFTGQEDNIIYAEGRCQGPGSDTSSRVSWEKKFDSSWLSEYSTSEFINKDGWINRLPTNANT